MYILELVISYEIVRFGYSLVVAWQEEIDSVL